jgi:hypothetical protein
MATPALAAPSWSNFVKWGSALAALLVVGVVVSENTSGGKAASGIMWLAALGAFAYFYTPLTQELTKLTGQTAFTSGGAPAPVLTSAITLGTYTGAHPTGTGPLA